MLLSYQLDAIHLVVELGEVVDLDNEAAIEREIVRLLPCCGPRAIIVDLHTPLLTPGPWDSSCGYGARPRSAASRWRWWPGTTRPAKS
ncbi:hypothetical protein [Streptomyces sp. MNU77]|uniref:hypothetical protein n=1 Tax=Streptomyces sp. MNU77 TaxID=1573406 RepID=UPI002115FC58|nr:hypothetical protein [Streptomyces sp. MNU77]